MKRKCESGGRSLTSLLRDARRISLYTMVPRTGGYTYAVGVWDLSIVQGPFSFSAVPNPTSHDAQRCFHRCELRLRPSGGTRLTPGVGVGYRMDGLRFIGRPRTATSRSH
jgi:hypothetical protein